MYLKSLYTSTQSFARMSHHQEVTITVAPSSATLWEFEPSDPRVKFPTVGEPVMAGTPLLIKHSYTSHCLSTDEFYFKYSLLTQQHVRFRNRSVRPHVHQGGKNSELDRRERRPEHYRQPAQVQTRPELLVCCLGGRAPGRRASIRTSRLWLRR